MAVDYSNPRSPMLELMIELSEKHGRKWIPSKVLRAVCQKKRRKYNASTMNNLVKAGMVEKRKAGDYKLAPVSFRLKLSTEDTKRSYRKWQEDTKSKDSKHAEYLDELHLIQDEDVARAVIEKKVREHFEDKITSLVERRIEDWRSAKHQQQNEDDG